MKNLIVIILFLQCSLVNFAKGDEYKKGNNQSLPLVYGLLSTSSSSSSSVTVTTIAGSGSSGNTDGTGTTATFDLPNDVVVDSSGNIYVADYYNRKIRKITSGNVVTTLAGGSSAYDIVNLFVIDGTGSNARFTAPSKIALDSSGVMYVTDEYDIRKVTSSGVVTTVSSLRTCSSFTNTCVSAYTPRGVAIGSSGNVYFTDSVYNKIYKMNSSGAITLLAGSGVSGSANGTGSSANFYLPKGLAVDSSENVYVADWANSKIRKITSSGVVTTLAGSGSAGSKDGNGTEASFSGPIDVEVDSSGNVYVADTTSNKIRKITPSGAVTTVAGSGGAFDGGKDGSGTQATFFGPSGIALDSLDNIYVADTYNHKIRKITFGK